MYSVVIEWQCDRCRRRTAGQRPPANDPERRTIPGGWSTLTLPAGGTRHLCDDCSVRLVAWINGGT